MPPARKSAALLVLAAASFGSACVSIQPFARVRAALPSASLVDVAGQDVHVEQSGPPDAEAVVLLHGFGGSTYMFRHILPALGRTHRVIAIDLNGFGWTERPRELEAYTRAGQGRLVVGVLDALGVERAHLLGHSYGGAIAAEVTARHPERVRTLILVDSAAPTYPDDRRSGLARIGPVAGLYVRSVALRQRGVRRALEGSVADDRVVTDEMVRECTRRLRVEGVERAFRGLTVPRPAEPAIDLATLGVPVLLVWGAADTLVPLDGPRGAREVAARIPGAELEVIAGVGHLPMEEAPAELVQRLVPWLERHAAEPR